MSDANYEHLWQDKKNWGDGFCGWYFCKEDPRLWVPKKHKALGITVNLGHPKGGATLVALFVTPVVLMAVGMVVAALLAKSCG